MGFARAADVPVVLIGDIDRGGVIAQIVGTQGGARSGRRGAWSPASSSTSSAATPRCSRTGMRDHRASTPAGRRSAWCRYFRAARAPAGGGRGGAASAREPRGGGPVHDRRAAAAAHRQFRRSRSAAAGAGRAAGHGRAGRAAAGRATSSSCPAPRRRSPISRFLRAQGWDIDLLAHVAARRPRARAVRRLSDAGPARRRPARASRARRARSRGSACSTSRPC